MLNNLPSVLREGIVDLVSCYFCTPIGLWEANEKKKKIQTYSRKVTFTILKPAASTKVKTQGSRCGVFEEHVRRKYYRFLFLRIRRS